MARKTVDTGLDETKTVLGIEILAVDVQVLTDGHSLLDQVVKILRDGGGKTCINTCTLVIHFVMVSRSCSTAGYLRRSDNR